MLKRVGLFLLTNFLVIITVSLVLNIVLPMFGIELQGATGLAIFCGIFGMTGAFISLAMSKWMAKRAYNIHIISHNDNNYELREIHSMVAELARKAGLPKTPEVGIYQSPDPNAFATGPSKSSSLVAFSTGLLDAMDRKEIEAVAAHEISHIANGDMVTMTLLTGIANALVMFLARLIAGAINNAMSDEEGEGLGFFAYVMVVMLLETVLMIFASIPIAAFSRYREYRADAGSAKLTSPHSMADALKALSRISGRIPEEKDQFAIAKIASKQKTSLWATHPSLQDRIKRLETGRF